MSTEILQLLEQGSRLFSEAHRVKTRGNRQFKYWKLRLDRIKKYYPLRRLNIWTDCLRGCGLSITGDPPKLRPGNAPNTPIQLVLPRAQGWDHMASKSPWFHEIRIRVRWQIFVFNSIITFIALVSQGRSKPARAFNWSACNWKSCRQKETTSADENNRQPVGQQQFLRTWFLNSKIWGKELFFSKPVHLHCITRCFRYRDRMRFLLELTVRELCQNKCPKWSLN